MNLKQINDIVNNYEKFDIFYDNRAVWIQEINPHEQTAKVGFIDNFEEKDVSIYDLHE